MKLTVQQVFDATHVITRIVQSGRPLPTKGAYRLARMHAKLLPEFNLIAERRDKMITAYGYKQEPVDTDGPEPGFSVPPDKVAEFNAGWGEMAREVIEVEVEPIPLQQLDLGGASSITGAEFATLGDLVTDG